MVQEWYYTRDGKERHGPLSHAELKQLIASGELRPTDMVWNAGMEKWTQAGSVEGLFPAVTAPSAKSAPPPLPAEVGSAAVGELDELEEVKEEVEAKDGKPKLMDNIKMQGQRLKKQGESVKRRLQSEETRALVQKAKDRWRTATPAVKSVIVGGGVGGVVLVLLLFCILPLAWLFGGLSGISSVPVRQVALAYAKDATAADKKYKGKTLTMSGVVVIDSGMIPGMIHLEVGNDLQFGVVAVAEFGAKYHQRVGQLKKGTEVKFKGLCKGFSPDIDEPKLLEFINCELISPLEADGDREEGAESNNDQDQPPAGGRRRDGRGAGKNNGADNSVTHDLVASKIRQGMTPAQVRGILGQPDKEDTFNMPPVVDPKTGRPVTDPKNRKPIPTEINQLIWTYNSKDDGAIVVLFQDGKVRSAGSDKKGDISLSK